jgi:hypothetical protein
MQVAWQVCRQVTSQVTAPQLCRQLGCEQVRMQVLWHVGRQVMPQVRWLQVLKQVIAQVGRWGPAALRSGSSTIGALISSALVAAKEASKSGESGASVRLSLDGTR